MQKLSKIEKIQLVIEDVWHSEIGEFYRDHWKNAGIQSCPSIKSIADLQKIPTCTKTHLELARQTKVCSYVPHNSLVLLHSTTGTTSNQPFYVWRNDFATSYYVDVLRTYGTKRILIIWNHSKVALWQAALHSVGIESVAVDPHRIKDCEQLLQTGTFDTLAASPSIATMLPEYVTDKNVLAQIVNLDLGGEATSEPVRRLLEQQYSKARIFTNFSSVESSGIAGYHTPDCSGDAAMMHASDDFVIDIENEEIALTSVNTPLAFPLIRYRTGDTARWVQDTCDCGSDAPMFQLTGRSGVDFVRVRGLEIRAEFIQEVLAHFDNLLKPVMHAEISELLVGQKVVAHFHLQLVLQDDVVETVANKSQLLVALDSMLVSRSVTLKHAVALGLFDAPTIEFVSEYVKKDKNKSIKYVPYGDIVG